MRRYIKFVVILLIFIVAGIFFTKKRANRALPVEVAETKISDIVTSVAASGEIKSENDVELKFTTSGKIIYLPFKVGDKVTKETALVRIDSTETLKNLENARIAKQKAINAADEIRETYEGNINEGPGLYKLKQAEKAILQAENNIRIYENALSKRTLYAPFDGTIVERNKVEGEIAQVTDTKPVIRLADLDNLYFEAQVDEEDIAKVALNQKSLIELDSYPDIALLGQVSELEKMTMLDTAGNKVIKIKIIITDNNGVELRLGLSGDAKIIQEEERNVLTVPIEAVLSEKEGDFVYAVDQGIASKRAVTLGLENDDSVEILAGLKGDEKVIVSDLERVSSGQKVSWEEAN